MYASSLKHPYGCLPSGNQYLCRDHDILYTRTYGCGSLYVLSDEILIDMLSYLSAIDLCQASVASRALYVYANHFELWRDLMLRCYKGRHINYRSSWKDTYIHAYMKYHHHIDNPTYPLVIPMKVHGIFSNLMYRSWSCSTFDYESACPGFLSHHNIETIYPHHNLNIQDFYEKYEVPRIPVILKDAAKDWPAMKKWNKEYLIKTCGDNTYYRATSATAPLSAEFTMKQYFQYAEQAIEEAPLYLFERDFMHLTSSLFDDYTIPTYFTPSSSSSSTSSGYHHDTDLFRVFGENRRPDHRWLVIGPKRSGSIFHIDPNATHAWNACIQGRKKWIFYPSSNPPPGVKSSADGADVAVPVSTGEWLLSFWKYHLQQRHHADVKQRPIECIALPGDVVCVPQGCWHMVVNLEDSIALTQNYVSCSNLPICLHFLREKRDQISGVRAMVRGGEDAMQASSMYEEFIDKLSSILSSQQLQDAMTKSYDVSSSYDDHDDKHHHHRINMHRLKRVNMMHRRRDDDKDKHDDDDDAADDKTFKFNFE